VFWRFARILVFLKLEIGVDQLLRGRTPPQMQIPSWVKTVQLGYIQKSRDHLFSRFALARMIGPHGRGVVAFAVASACIKASPFE
jgi:hypothetical protein